jgi:hypothetical protein
MLPAWTAATADPAAPWSLALSDDDIRLALFAQAAAAEGSVESSVPLVNDLPLYDFKAEFRIGFIF